MKITVADKELIKAAIFKAESQTSGEIVPVILKESDFYLVSHFRWALLLSVIFPLYCYFFCSFEDISNILLAQGIGLVLGYLIAFIPFLKRLFITQREMVEETHQRSLQIFHENKVSMTKDRTGIIIFISLLERRVDVLADAGINERVEKEYWHNLVNNLLKKIKKKQVIEGMIEAIEHCGDSLKGSFPIQADDINEISNELITD